MKTRQDEALRKGRLLLFSEDVLEVVSHLGLDPHLPVYRIGAEVTGTDPAALEGMAGLALAERRIAGVGFRRGRTPLESRRRKGHGPTIGPTWSRHLVLWLISSVTYRGGPSRPPVAVPGRQVVS